MLYRPSRRDRSIIVDLSPLIDVVFLLVIFLLVSTRFVDDGGLDLALPGSKSRSEAVVENLTLYIDKAGIVYLDDTPQERAGLESAVRTRLEDFENKMVVLRVDKNVPHGQVVDVMDAAKTAGASGLTFATVVAPSEER